ncbi:Zinc finger, CCHC-type, partial [Kalmanozyma brasiliensis GHG001]|uniref:Zinc finger, CCHC-type n=1 Tax=Kalmanozyma brasiliensis (strain GHG001) TaxID=1365824 RepID=UPI002867DAA6
MSHNMPITRSQTASGHSSEERVEPGHDGNPHATLDTVDSTTTAGAIASAVSAALGPMLALVQDLLLQVRDLQSERVERASSLRSDRAPPSTRASEVASEAAGEPGVPGAPTASALRFARSMLGTGVEEGLRFQQDVNRNRQANVLFTKTPHQDALAEKAPKICITAPSWDGERDDLEAYLEQCELHFDLNPTRFKDDHRRVLWAMAHVTGAPRDRLRNLRLSPTMDPLFHSWEVYCADLRRTYGDPLPGHTVRIKLQQLRQTGSVSAYAAEFQALANRSHATDLSQLLATFQLGLKMSFRRQALHIQTQDFHEYVDACICTEQQMHETGLVDSVANQTAQRSNTAGEEQFKSVTTARATTMAETPKSRYQDKSGKSQESHDCNGLLEELRRHRRENRQCYGCGSSEHIARDCPKVEKTRTLRANVCSLDNDGSGDILMHPGDDDLASSSLGGLG